MSLAFRLGFSVMTRRIISNLGDDFKRFPHPVKVSMSIFQSRLRLRVAQEKHHIGQARAVADTPYTAAAGDYTILANAVGGAMTVTLPSATGSGRILNIKKIDASASTVTIDGFGAETIDGAATYVISTQWVNITIQDGAAGAWYIL